MTTITIPVPDVRRGWRKLLGLLIRTVGIAVPVLRARSRPLTSHLRDHTYTIIGFGMFDAAMFVHSLFTGLLVTGISWVVFEYKVSE